MTTGHIFPRGRKSKWKLCVRVCFMKPRFVNKQCVVVTKARIIYAGGSPKDVLYFRVD